VSQNRGDIDYNVAVVKMAIEITALVIGIFVHTCGMIAKVRFALVMYIADQE
jgi:hypothetical protein